MRLVMKTYKYKLYNNKKNKYLVQQIEIASEIWNFCIAMRRMYSACFYNTISRLRAAFSFDKITIFVKKLRKCANW